MLKITELLNVKNTKNKKILELEISLAATKNQLSEIKTVYEDLKRAERKGLEETIILLRDEKRRLIEIDNNNEDKINAIKNTLFEEYRLKLAEQMKLVEERIEGIVKERVMTTIAEIKAENISLKKDKEDLELRMKFYKEKFESGKIEIGADEIKGFLMSANPHGAEIMKQLRDSNERF